MTEDSVSRNGEGGTVIQAEDSLNVIGNIAGR